MSSKLLKRIILITIALIVLYIPHCFAAGANVSTSASTAKPGDTIELYIDLTTSSIGYDIQITTDNENLISASEVIDKIGSGDSSRIYLVQLAGAADRITYPSGTRIAKIKYTISENATEGDKITFNVAGSVAGETSSDKNSMNESATISIINPPNTDDGSKEENPPQEETPPQEEIPPQEETTTPPQEEVPPQEETTTPPQEEVPPQEETPPQEVPPQEEKPVEQPEEQEPVQEGTQKQEEIDDTVAKVEIPKAGLKSFTIFLGTIVLVVMYISFKKYSKNKDIK